MKILKSLVLSLLSFLLFLSLSIFGLAFMLANTLLNPDFVTAELDRLDVSSLTEELFAEQIPKEELRTALIDTMADLEPLVKDQVSAAIYPTYDYLLGKSQDLNLALTLKNTILNSGFVVSLVDKLDLPFFAGEFLTQQLNKEIPKEMASLTEYLDDAIAAVEPQLKEQISTAAEPVVDYLLGERQSFNILISLEPVKESLRDTLRAAFLASPPAELADLPQSELKQYFDKFFGELDKIMPSTIELDESMIGTEVPANITKALAEAEEVLGQGKQVIGYFQLVYKALIGLMVLLVLGIILLSRQVKDITRRLGTTFLTFGAIEYASIFVTKYLVGIRLPLPEIPASLQTWLPQFLDNLLAPLAMFSLGLLIVGIVLIIVSFVSKPRPASS